MLISKDKHNVITEESAKEILTKYGVKVPAYSLVSNADEAVEKSKDLGFPLVAKIVSSGIELIIGLQNDPQFGPVIMVGLGGIYTEIFKDVAFRMLPITKQDANEMLEGLKGKQILKGFRGAEPIDIENML